LASAISSQKLSGDGFYRAVRHVFIPVPASIKALLSGINRLEANPR